MKSIRLLLIGLLCSAAFAAHGQMRLIGEVKTDSFPHLSFRLNHRDPADLSEQFALEDGGKDVKFTVDAQAPADSGHNKAILILWEYLPAAARDAQNKFFRQLILRALPDLLQDGDVVNVATFAWTDQKKGAATISPLSPTLGKDTASLRQLVTLAKPPGGKGIDAAHGSELYPALDEAIDEFADVAAGDAKMIIVLSAEFPNIFNPSPDQSTVQDKALKENVAIYNVRYKLMAEKYSLDALAKNTFGTSYQVDPKSPDAAVGAVLEMADNAVERSLGMDYAFSVTSATPADGKTHPLQIKAGNASLSINYDAPSPGIGAWIKENLVLFIVLIVVLLGGIAGLLLYLRKRSQAEAARRAEEERKVAEIAAQGQETDNRLAHQRAQLEQMQREEQARKRSAEDSKRQEEVARETEALMKEMYANGKQPRLTTIVNGAPITMELPSPVTTVGRDAACDVKIADPTISRHHFQVIYQGGKYTLMDLGSTNGTLLNGERAHQTELRHGDQIKAGEAILFFYI